jgi:uncharacterized protein with von Willebrand factor type A (vWA) domain
VSETAAAGAADRLARLGGALREQGLPTSVRDEIDAATVLPLVDELDRAEVRDALRIALKIPRPAWALYERVLAEVWYDEAQAPRETRHRAAADALPRGQSLAWNPETRSMSGEEGPPGAAPEGDQPAFSPAALLRRKSFDERAWSPQELAAMERALARLARRLAAHRSRRLVAASALARGRVDPRRSYRRALRTAGEILGFARRTRALDQPRLVFLCDTSGSMDLHTRFLLTFVLALRRAARRAEVFAFNTDLVHLTPHLVAGRTAAVIDRLGTLVPDWSGGTRIGACLGLFAARYLARFVDGKTVVVILSDGLDRGEPGPLTEALRAIHVRARRIVWLNPLMGDPRYEPTAAGMQAALPFIDNLVPAHNLESLERLLPHLWI